jgi:hypothetical protein
MISTIFAIIDVTIVFSMTKIIVNSKSNSNVELVANDGKYYAIICGKIRDSGPKMSV